MRSSSVGAPWSCSNRRDTIPKFYSLAFLWQKLRKGNERQSNQTIRTPITPSSIAHVLPLPVWRSNIASKIRYRLSRHCSDTPGATRLDETSRRSRSGWIESVNKKHGCSCFRPPEPVLVWVLSPLALCRQSFFDSGKARATPIET